MSIHRRNTSKGIVYDVRLRDYGRKNISRTFRNHREAKQFEHYILTKKAQEEFPEVFSQKKQRITIEQLAKQWLELHSKPNKAPKSYTKDRGVLFNYLVPRFGDRPIHRVGTA